MRVFFAIDIPEDIKTGLSDLITELRPFYPKYAIRWAHPHRFHITLQFLKDIDPGHLDGLVEEASLVLAKMPAFDVQLGPLELFPTSTRPKIVSLATEPQDVLKDMALQLGQAIAALGYPTESRPFRGHMTLGRFNFDREKAIYVLPKIVLPMVKAFRVSEVMLFQSQTELDQTRYVSLKQIGLSG